MSFNAIHENKILAKISEFTEFACFVFCLNVVSESDPLFIRSRCVSCTSNKYAFVSLFNSHPVFDVLCRYLKQLNVYTIILTKPTEIQKRGQLGFFGSIYMHVSLFSSMMCFFYFSMEMLHKYANVQRRHNAWRVYEQVY